MGGFFGAALRDDAVFDVFYGTDYHSHLGTRRAGMAMYDSVKGFDRAIHNIESSNFRPKFEKDLEKMKGNLGIGCISDFEPQPLIVRSHHGTYAITTVGKINNIKELTDMLFSGTHSHFLEMSGGDINPTEMVASLINQKSSIVEGILYAQEMVEGSMTFLIMTPKGIYASRDKWGRTPAVIGKKDNGYCVCFESFSYLNLGYLPEKELGPGEVVFIDPEGYEVLVPARDEMRICTFLWIYYGFPASSYEGVNVEDMRYGCGMKLADRDIKRGNIHPDCIAGVPDSGVAHAIGYANRSGVPYSRPFVKYTPTWPRSFMPTIQSKRDLIAKMKLIPVHELIEGRRLLLIDDSIVRGTQLRETTEFLYRSGAKEVHVRPACPPILFGCKYINFSRSTSEMELIGRRVIRDAEGENVSREVLEEYADPDSARYRSMLDAICAQLNFTSLNYNRLDDLVTAIGLRKDQVCTYCWDGKE